MKAPNLVVVGRGRFLLRWWVGLVGGVGLSRVALHTGEGLVGLVPVLLLLVWQGLYVATLGGLVDPGVGWVLGLGGQWWVVRLSLLHRGNCPNQRLAGAPAEDQMFRTLERESSDVCS